MCKVDNDVDTFQFLRAMEKRTQNVRSIALWRLSEVNLAAKYVPMLQEIVQNGLKHRRENDLDLLQKFLQAHLRISQMDSTLSEEIGKAGSHSAVVQVLQYDASNLPTEKEQDEIMDLQDIAGEIAACYTSFPMKVSPLSFADMQRRLPIVFGLQNTNGRDVEGEDHTDTEQSISSEILIHQVTERQTAQADVGFVLWPSAVILAKHLQENPNILDQASSVLELGAGCGLTGLAAAKLVSIREQSHAKRVILSDFNPKVLENLRYNVQLNGLDSTCDVVSLDFYKQKKENSTWVNMEGELHEQVDLVIAADVICQASDAVACAQTIFSVLKPGAVAYCVCADAHHRFGVDRLADECRKAGLHVDTRPAEIDVEHEDLKRTSGYVPGMELTFFTMTKQLKRSC